MEKLSRMYPYLSNEDLSKILSRNINSIQHKANRLKLKKDKEVNSIIRGKSREGEKCCNWKGGRKITNKGYVQILKKGYIGTDCGGYIFEHRYIMEQFIGRHLNSGEVVHHKNGNKQDNIIENLALMKNGEHTILHHKGVIRSKSVRMNISEGAKIEERRLY